MLIINKTLIDLSKGFRGWILVIVILKLIVLMGISMFATSIGTSLGMIYDAEMSIADLKAELIVAALATAIMGIGDMLVGEAEFRCTAKARISLRKEIFNKMLKLDVADIDALGATSAINSAVDGIELMLIYYNRYLPGLIYSVLAPIYLFWALKDKCFPVALMLFIVSMVITPINNIFKQINDKMKGDYWNTLSKLTSYYLESINGLTTTELFNRGDDREKKLGGIAMHLRDIIVEVMVINFSSTALNELLINLAIFAAAGMVCWQMVIGNIDLNVALTVLLLSYSFYGSIRALQWIAHDALHGVAAAHNVADILNIDTDKPTAKDIKGSESFKGIEFEDVSFSYKERPNILKEINLVIPKNKVTAIVGESGCGKSTIVNMLLRFFDAKTGKITLDGRDYKSIEPVDLRRQIIMVPQVVYIFSGTIRENLQFADENASEEELWLALEQVKLDDWVRSLPQKLDAPVGDAGGRLSGGQRQKIGIARALLSKAEYIIFDEATSSVDEINEREIWRCIGELAHVKTLIIISHRLSTIQNADLIYLIENGSVKEQGGHDKLMKIDGQYAALVNQQKELEMFGRNQVRL